VSGVSGFQSQEVEAVLNPAASELHERDSIQPETRPAWSGLASRCSRKPTMSCGPAAAVGARIPESPSWNRFRVT
jgi:hypothetical protein